MQKSYSKDNAIRRSLSDFTLAKQLKLRLGKVLARIFSQRAEIVEKAPFSAEMSALDRLVRNGLQAQALEGKNYEPLRRYLSHYWGEEAKNFHDGWQDRFERMFLNHDVIVIDELQKLLELDPSSTGYDRLYEIGCGGGQVLDYLCKRLSDIEEFVGIDIGSAQIEANHDVYKGTDLSFHTADAVEWIPTNAKPNSVFLTNGGVFEYFLREELVMLFKHIAENCRPAAVAIVETIGSDHDLEGSSESFVYGRELSFSHNYPALLREAGFKIAHQSERVGYEVDGGGRWIRLLATNG